MIGAAPTPALRADDPALSGRRAGCSTRRSRVPRRLGGAPARRSRPAAGRSSSPTTTTRTSTTPPRSCSRCAARARRAAPSVDGGDRPRRRAGPSACSPQDGGWGAFDADNTRALCDAAAVLRLRRGDRPAERRRHRARRRDARRRGPAPTTAVARRGVDWLLREQEPDGSWFGRWGANYVYGTGAVVPGAGRRRRAAGPPARSAAPSRWLESAPERRRRLGRGPALLRRPDAGAVAARPPPSQTAWALLALLAAGERGDGGRAAASRWLVDDPARRTARWDEP